MSKYRGNYIKLVGDKWVYSDTQESVEDTHESRPCGNCNRVRTDEGHDACLGTLPLVINACCGHGEIEEAYVQFLDGSIVSGEDTKIMIVLLLHVFCGLSMLYVSSLLKQIEKRV
jgi:hypothetical protein